MSKSLLSGIDDILSFLATTASGTETDASVTTMTTDASSSVTLTTYKATDTALVDDATGVITVNNFINNEFVAPVGGEYLDVQSPSDGSLIGRVAMSTATDVDLAVECATKAFADWSQWTVKERMKPLLRLQNLLASPSVESELCDIIMLEHGKNRAEALGEIRKGNETVEYALAMPLLMAGRRLQVSRGVECSEVRVPHGVVSCIVPFNFPLMIEAGFPKGVFQAVNGGVSAAEALVRHCGVRALSFVGSTKVAAAVYSACKTQRPPKRALCLGGAKNHLVAATDCNEQMTATDVVNSFAGCSGQRCMAASVLLIVGDQKSLLSRICKIAKGLRPGTGPREFGPLIDASALERVQRYIASAEADGHKVLVDGRSYSRAKGKGFWIGPTVVLFDDYSHAAMTDEVFGPMLSVYICRDNDEAVAIENANPYGNAACVYTDSGRTAQWFSARFGAAMVGVNVGVPVPREPFAFGGIGMSKFGDCDITADGGVEFWTFRKKITTKWVAKASKTWMD